MTGITSLVQGSYAYLLIFQILLVTMLFLTLIWLIARRVRYPAGQSSAAVDSSLLQAGEAAMELSAAQAAELEALRAQVEKLEHADEEIKKLEDKNLKLTEKVKYLEQRLLEYEILQEEIGTLSHLKVENEKLKERLMKASRGEKVDDTPAESSES